MWALEKVEDLSGNYIEYTYRTENPETIAIAGTSQQELCSAGSSACLTPEIVPHSIAWGGNTQGLGHDRSVEFGYVDTRSDSKSFFSGGAEVKRIHLLNRIDVKVGGTVVRRYRFKNVAASNAVTEVREISDCAVTAGVETCKAPTVFEYKSSTVKLSAPVATGATANVAKEFGIGKNRHARRSNAVRPARVHPAQRARR